MNENWLNKFFTFSKQTPQKKALGIYSESCRIEWLTFKQLYGRVLLAAHHLLHSGLKPGDRALLMCPSSLDFTVAFLGCMFSGIIAVPLYPPRSNRKADRVLAVSADCKPNAVIGRFSDSTSNLGAILDDIGICALKIDSLELINYQSSLIHLPRTPAPHDLAFLQYTSGSTGTPKGVMVTHANLTHNINVMGERIGFNNNSCFVSWLPIYHDMGLILGLLEPLAHGVSTILMPPVAFFSNPMSWLELMSEEKATHSAAPNFAYELCVERVDEEQLKRLDLSNLRAVISAAEPVRYETQNRFARKFASAGLPQGVVKPCYGLAEATLAVTTVKSYREMTNTLPVVLSKLDHDNAEVSASQEFKPVVGCGWPLRGLTIRVVKPNTSQPLKDGEVGEILIQGASVAAGYWQNPEATRKTFNASVDGLPGNFMRTGDLGFVKDQELFITGRRKDLIILRGRNIYPQDIELTVQKAWHGFRQGYGAAFTIDEDSHDPKLVVVQEVERRARRKIDAEFDAAKMFRNIREYHDLSCFELVLVKPNSISMTSSGKIQRRRNRRLYFDQSFTSLARFKGEDFISQTFLENSPAIEQRDDVYELVCKLIAHHTGMEAADLRPEDLLGDYGFDSLLVTYLAQSLSKCLKRPVNAVWFLDTPTLEALIDRICGQERSSEDRFSDHNSESSLFLMANDPLLMVEGMTEDQIRLEFERTEWEQTENRMGKVQ